MVSLNDLKKFAKEKKLVSDGLKLLNNPLANTASGVAAHLGYGKKRKRGRKRKRKQQGGSLLSDLGLGVGSAAAGIGTGLGRLFSGGARKKGRMPVIKM